MAQGDTDGRTTSEASRQRSTLFGALVGLTTLVVLLPGVWAGIFLQRGGSETWVNVHAVGAYVAIVLAVAAAIVAVVQLRSRRDLLIGSAMFALLIIIETAPGGAVGGGADGLTVVHVPLAMAIMAWPCGCPRAHAAVPDERPGRHRERHPGWRHRRDGGMVQPLR